MDLRSTILGLLSWRAASGYDLKRIISDSEIYYWSGNNNQIYKTLLELQNEGFVTNEVQVQEKLPAKKIYSITKRGEEELRHGLRMEPELPEIRKGFLIQLAWAEPLSDEEVLDLLEIYAEEITTRIRMFQAQAGAQPARQQGHPGRSPRERYLFKRINENLRATYQSELDWVRQIQKDIRKGTYDEYDH